ncbi:hypothetical protein BBOV_II004460 [Babesia bovis T2Bo]|uniref:Uncharacterized protein n=1 Tax=Babesia bovis TaxID=5865 RepID=A7ATZ0_BABBO|nr:hypothetical protein BBOV_II004460 [Babesia bovis T2Bo]EDO06401.1 hypothetical protein BBOV_II004460 [Babesia bovis T2Bo]|eukprot:XP_001609969.1 hypothetical protein [Babesia bovis T2Bo]
MSSVSTCKLDKIAHEIFANTLRAPYTSPRDGVPDSRRLRYADIVASLAHKLSDPRSVKLNLLRLPELRNVSNDEMDFLKAAVPMLVSAARPYNTQYNLDNGTARLYTWAGCGGAVVSGCNNDVSELLISPQAFKNTLLKLLNGNSDDNRVVTIRERVSGVPWFNSIDTVENEPVNEDVECTFKPKINKYPRYLHSAPKLAYPANSLPGQLKRVLDTPTHVDEPMGYYGYDDMDYGSPFNNTCPLGASHDDTKHSRSCEPRKCTDVVCSNTYTSRTPRTSSGTTYRPTPLMFQHPWIGGDLDKLNADIDAEVDAIMAGMPSMRRPYTVKNTCATDPLLTWLDETRGECRSKITKGNKGFHAAEDYNKEQLSYLTPMRNHICATVERDPASPQAFKDTLRGGYIYTGMNFSTEPETPSRGVGSMKQCDYVIPSKMPLPSFARRSARGFYRGSKHNGDVSSLDMIEAQLAQPSLNIRKMLC